MGASEWNSGYSSTGAGTTYAPYSPMQPPFAYEPPDPSALHLPTVLPDSSSLPESSFSSIPTATPAFPPKTPTHSSCTALTELDSVFPSPRYHTDTSNAYNYNAWSSNGYNSYNNYQYNNLAMNNNPNLNCAQTQPYLAPNPPTMVLYPHLYSTVNQNQIHLHLHGAADKLDQYLSTDGAFTISAGTSSKGSIEIGIGVPPQNAQTNDQSMLDQSSLVQTVSDTSEEVKQMYGNNSNQDPSTVWRPY